LNADDSKREFPRQAISSRIDAAVTVAMGLKVPLRKTPWHYVSNTLTDIPDRHGR